MWRVLSLAFVAIFAMSVAAVGFSRPGKGTASETQAGPSTSRTASSVKRLSTSTSEEIEVLRSPAGRFEIGARVNGQDTQFLVDTGADTVAISPEEAERLGVTVNPDDFQPIARTASGIAHGARVELRQIEIGGQEYRDVEAIIIEGLDVNLLGQSLLRRMGKLEISQDRLTIRRS